jgi:hypothetical protein
VWGTAKTIRVASAHADCCVVDRYALHAGRHTVEQADVALLMDRQRLTMGVNTPTAIDLARRHLPMEVLTDLLPVAIMSNTVVPVPPRQKRKRHA